jgi:hypothetical protein
MYCPQTNCKFTEFPEIQSKNVTGYNKEQCQRIVFNQCKNVYKTIFCQLFNSSGLAKGDHISAAGATDTEVCKLEVEYATRDVLFLLHPQHNRPIFLLLLKLKETSIQLVQGNE